MDDSLPDQLVLPPRGPKRQSNYWLIAAAAAAFAGAALLFVLVHNADREPKRSISHQTMTNDEDPDQGADDAPAAAEGTADAPDEVPLVDDDGHTLWVSPTHGPPLDLAYL